MIPIKVPPLGESIVEATVARWLKNEGDAVATGEPLVELETDKITVEVPAMKAGVLTKRLRAEGDVVKVDEILGELDETAQGAAAQPASRAAPVTSAPAAAQQASPATTTPAPQGQERGAGAVRASPAAQRMASEAGIDLARVAGTGRGGVVSKPDVIEQTGRPAAQRNTPVSQPAQRPAAQQAPAAVQAPRVQPPEGNGARETREKMSTRRKRIAEHLVESQHTTAHLTTFNEVDMTGVQELRERSKARIEKEHGVKLTFMPFFVKAACLALRAYPSINAMVDGDHIVYRHYVNMGIAVANEQGIVVPNIRDADSMSMLDIARSMTDLAARARENKLAMEDLTGGTFTITNGGVFGSLLSTPILNSPQSGILGLHKIQERPMGVNGKIELRPMMYVALSYDHRIVEGQHAVQFLVKVKELMEDPAMMLVE